MKIFVWGVGDYFSSRISADQIEYYGIEGFIDKNVTEFYGKKVIKPFQIPDSDIERIIIGSKIYRNEILAEIKLLYKDKKSIFIDDFITEKWFDAMPVYCKEALNEHDRMLNIALKARELPQDRFEGAMVFANRISALDIIPKGGIVAEIGVAYGDFSDIILNTIKPDRFLAIDYFNGDSPGGDIWGRTEFADTGLTHRQWYSKRFKKYIDNGVMNVFQGLSWEVLKHFDDRSLDYVYLDACHSYDSVLKDVEILKKKIKPGGIITFNDYTFYNLYTNPLSAEGYYGVANVANELITSTQSVVLGIALERCLSMDLIVRFFE